MDIKISQDQNEDQNQDQTQGQNQIPSSTSIEEIQKKFPSVFGRALKLFGTRYNNEKDKKSDDIVSRVLSNGPTELLEIKDSENNTYVSTYYVSTMTKGSIMNPVLFVWDSTLESAQRYDSSIIDLKVIEEGVVIVDLPDGKGDSLQIKAEYKVRRQVNQMMRPIWNRETVFAQVKFELTPSETLITSLRQICLVGFSVNSPHAPLDTANFVRTDVNFSVYKFTEKTLFNKIERVANILPGGNIPGFVVKSQAAAGAKLFEIMASDFKE